MIVNVLFYFSCKALSHLHDIAICFIFITSWQQHYTVWVSQHDLVFKHSHVLMSSLKPMHHHKKMHTRHIINLNFGLLWSFWLLQFFLNNYIICWLQNLHKFMIRIFDKNFFENYGLSICNFSFQFDLLNIKIKFIQIICCILPHLFCQ